MKPLFLLLMMGLLLAACNVTEEDPAPRPDVTLPASQIAANVRPDGQAPSETPVTPPATAELVTAGASDEVTPTASPTDEAAEATDSPTRTPQATATREATPEATSTEAEETASDTEATDTVAAEESDAQPAALPTSNAEELRALQDNGALSVVMEFPGNATRCFVANEAIPFRLIVRNVSQNEEIFYLNGGWRLSLNNSPVGPTLAISEPTLREEFATLAPNAIQVRNEEDLGLWVLSIGPEMFRYATPTGFGLPAGEYWVTFLYTNDKDGLTEQIDGTFLVSRAAWRGTTVAPENRLRVVEDPSECES